MIIKDFKNLPSAQSELEAISEWKKEFREYVDSLDIARDDWKGIIEYIDELPSIQPNHCAEVGKKVLIDRQEALEIIRKMQTYKLFAGDDMLLIDQAEAQTELMMLPSAQPEHKTGRWIPCPQNASWLYVYKCSECGGYLQISDVDGKGYKANYCSYCGAKMEGGEQE